MDLSNPDCAVILEEPKILLSWLQCKFSIVCGDTVVPDSRLELGLQDLALSACWARGLAVCSGSLANSLGDKKE
ncbi:hypothetical protein HGM15179_011178 [Zosterops borbonicus]|uniref:Uncharacterized protein n=1 Tax=Zosterops borbonicus TaxID=364589 RepID=A0A8K1GCL3_9PASS|nr:hypothetical protein HGM15179_011178 [Zosterops borbonicus]